MLEMLFKVKKKLVSIIFQTGRFITLYKAKVQRQLFANYEGCDQTFSILFFKEKLFTLSKQTNWSTTLPWWICGRHHFLYIIYPV